MIDRVDSRNFNYDEGRKTLENEVVVFTGRGFTVRWELAQFARNCRAKVESTVTSRTTLLIVGEKPGWKRWWCSPIIIELLLWNKLSKII